MPKKHTDVLIIGAGLAGSLLAWRLLQTGQKIQLIHHPSITSASRVAAGLINPVTGQRLVLQKNIDQLLASAHQLYRQLGEEFNQPFFFKKTMLRTLQSKKDQAAWKKRQRDPRYQSYLSNMEPSQCEGQQTVIQQHQTGYLDTNTLLNSLHRYFQQKQSMHSLVFDSHDLQIHHDHIVWQEIRASQLILCQGWRGMHCNFFSYLPFQPAKGEILTLSTSDILPKHIIHQGKWLLPLNHKAFKLGATYQHQNIDEKPSEAGKQELLKALISMGMAQKNITLKQHQAGIRPNTLDKQPFLGMHPKYPSIGIFNGFGSKGSLLIPWYAQRMAQYLEHQTPLPSHADIQRFSCA
ncbi:MAG: FAD-binding oxidoreductase [Mariprofundaceae bacterium]|nr:FAD-binding oxidoreductase [Mariprofundaceae bacterium]